jgi:hypothetical protein
MTNHHITRIRDLGVALKEMEPYVKDPQFLRIGRAFRNFPLRPREVWANWLLCVVGNYNNGNDNLTFADDPTGGDGIVLDRATERFMLTEHVFIPPPRPDSTETVEDSMVNAVNHKMQNGRPYAEGKHLIIFSEAVGRWYPNRVARRIAGEHAFNSVWAVGLVHGDESGYTYFVTRFDAPPDDSPSWHVDIDFAFTAWTVSRVQ